MTDQAAAPQRILVIGQGYVGLPLSIRAVEVGLQVIGLDLDEPRIRHLQAGESYVDDIADAQVRAALDSGLFIPTASYDDAAGFDVAVISVPTPLRERVPDLSYIERCGEALAPHIRRGSTVILESTTYPGTTQELLAPILEKGSRLVPGVDFHLGYSPERIDPGNPKFGFKNTPKVVAGVNESSLVAVRAFYDSMIDTTVPVSSCKAAELTKLLENTFRHVNIALINELAMFSHDLGIDVWEAIEASSTKPFGFMPFMPGPGVGGHCLPIDPSYLSWDVKRKLGMQFRFVELANDVNDHMPDYVVKRAGIILNDQSKSIRHSRILLIGLSYKKNSGDTRESPAMHVASRLLALGADLSFIDPFVESTDLTLPIKQAELTNEQVAEADLVILLTDHDHLDYSALSAAGSVLDCRNRLPAATNVIKL